MTMQPVVSVVWQTNYAVCFLFSLASTQLSQSSVIFIIIIYSLTARVVGAPQKISQPVSFIFPCSPLPSGTW